LIKSIRNTSYREAVEWLAARYNIALEDKHEDNKSIREAVEFAASWWKTDIEHGAIPYLEEKGIDVGFARDHGVGFCLPDSGYFLQGIRDNGLREYDFIRAGIVAKGQHGHYVPLSGRIIVTIYDAFGRPVGFSGRSLNKRGPKWKNSPNSPIFRRSNHLYGLNWARESRLDEFILTEGFFDVLSMRSAGHANVVASMGTSLTHEQASIASHYWSDAVVFYDGDVAGRRASYTASEVLLAAGVKPSICSPEQGIDPGCAITHPDSVQKSIDSAKDVIELKIQLLEGAGYFKDVSGRKSAMEKLATTVSATRSPVLKELYASAISEKVGISREAVLLAASGKVKIRGMPESAEVKSNDEMLVSAMACDGALLERVVSMGVVPDDVRIEKWRKLFQELLDTFGCEGHITTHDVSLTPEELEDVIGDFANRIRYREIEKLKQQMAVAEPHERIALLSALSDLTIN
jgi:DNA primase